MKEQVTSCVALLSQGSAPSVNGVFQAISVVGSAREKWPCVFKFLVRGSDGWLCCKPRAGEGEGS